MFIKGFDRSPLDDPEEDEAPLTWVPDSSTP